MAAGKNGRHQWEESYKRAKRRNCKFMTVSSEEVDPLYTPENLADFDYDRDLGYPGQFPFTRGVHPTMYRGQLWTMRQFAGMGSARDTNQRYHFLLDHGQTGLSVAFDMPTLMGYDSDHPFSEGEVGRCGVAIDSVEDMSALFEGIPLGKVSTSMTINGPASVLFAFYIVAGERQGVAPEKLRGTIQNDILKEYIAQKSWLVPPAPSMRIITDIMAFAADHVPQWNTISISGYHIREAGSTALQELAFTLADGFAYVEAGIKAGLDVDEFAPRLSFFFNAHSDFFEEIAKYRAARRIWAREMRDKYKAKDPRSWLLRFHTQTAGCSLTAQQPENNIVRTAYQALSAIMGGTQSLHTNSMDETYALPTEKAVRIALRTQQLIAHESGVPNMIDPLAGSYYVEALTNKMEEGAYDYFEQVEKLGGVIKAIELGFFQKEIAEAAKRYQREIETNERIIVGLNDFVLENEKPEIPLLKIDPRVEQEQRERLRTLRDTRDNAGVRKALEALADSARGTENVMPRIVECARSMATKGEICDVLREVYGHWEEPKIF
ncbi:methylmalonyl-CoA mutase family protein [Candidatus Poribacteria bacterium]|nr:methylmalonyl-CoA mutase family protein [Candidatus Poribacteria bacterium]